MKNTSRSAPFKITFTCARFPCLACVLITKEFHSYRVRNTFQTRQCKLRRNIDFCGISSESTMYEVFRSQNKHLMSYIATALKVHSAWKKEITFK